MKRLFSILAAITVSIAAFAQNEKITWNYHAELQEGNEYRVIFTGTIAPDYHTYTLTDELAPTEFWDMTVTGGELVGKPYEIGKPVEEMYEGELAQHYYKEIILAQNVKLTAPTAKITGTLFCNVCTHGACSPSYYDFEVILNPENAVMALDSVEEQAVEEKVFEAGNSEPSKAPERDIWSLILMAVIGGLAMIVTPCVFPMIPMTVSFFLKGSENARQGRFKASMYGLFIVLIYTLPIAILSMCGVFVNFNAIATHWLPNILFFVIFMIFAASFFGAFEITLPQSLVNKSDANSDKKGLIGVFFMALTLVLVSFSCTGPIVGTVLVEAVDGNSSAWQPTIVMLAFSIAFAIPFTLFAFFPSLLKKFKKSGGGWLNSVKVVLGFIEIALGLKFLSVADQTYHWGILDREIYLAIWIVVFSLLGLYLLGKIRFAHDEPLEYIKVPRLFLAITSLAFVVYLIPGMWGAPLKGIAGYLPPISTHDFIVEHTDGESLMDNLVHDYDEALAKAKELNKPIFVDVTGHGCVNCREMEARVWSDTQVKNLMNEYIILALYVDDKASLPKEKWVTDEETGQVYKHVGPANSYICRKYWNATAQPTYVLLSPDGKRLLPNRHYDLDVKGFREFLKNGLKEFKRLK